MFKLDSLKWWLDPVFAAVVCGTCLAGCDLAPSVLFVADGSPVRLLQLTDAHDGCPAPRRVCFLSTWDGETTRGCWVREAGSVRVSLPHEEQSVPVANFRPTAYAELRRVWLD